MSKSQSCLQHWCQFWAAFNKIWLNKLIFSSPNLLKGACILWRIPFKINMRISYVYRHTFDRFGRLYFNPRSIYYSTGRGKKPSTIKIKAIAHSCSGSLSLIKGSSAGFLKAFWDLILKTCIYIHICIYRYILIICSQWNTVVSKPMYMPTIQTYLHVLILYALSSWTEITPVIKLSKYLKTGSQCSDWEEIKENESELTDDRC